MNVLIIKLGALGDVLRTTFIARGIKEKYPEAWIVWLTKENAESILWKNPFIEEILLWNKRGALFNRKFDWIISLDDECDVCDFATLMKQHTKKFQGAYTIAGKKYYTDDVALWFGMGILRPEEQGGKKEADRLKALNRKTFQEIYAKMFGVEATKERKPMLCLGLEEQQYGMQILSRFDIPQNATIIGVNSGAGARWELKMLCIEKIATICKTIARDKNKTIILLGGTDERERNLQTKALCQEGNIIFIEPTLEIRKFASIINVCDLLITTDSLALHIGTALGKKIVVYFGPTSPWEIEMFGLGEKVYKESDCLCCYKQTTDKKPSCIDVLTPEDILEAVEKVME